MEQDTITANCIKKYVKVGGTYNIEVYVKDPGDEWGHLYMCRNCGVVAYSYNTIQDVNQLSCPKCNAQAENNFLKYPQNIMLDGELREVDDSQFNVRCDEATEAVVFPHIKIIKNNTVARSPHKGMGGETQRLRAGSFSELIKYLKEKIK